MAPSSAVNIAAVTAFAVACVLVAVFDWSEPRPLRDASLRWLSPCALVMLALGTTIIAWARRMEAWVVLLPAYERVRVIRLHGLSVEATTLPLSRALAAEYVVMGKDTWLLLVGEDGRSARVLPATPEVARSDALERLEVALNEARNGAPPDTPFLATS